MKQLPEAETYEEGLEYWPYRTSLAYVIKYICDNAPQNTTLLDVMCGPGYLLGKLNEKRPDISYSGVDIDERYVSHGKKHYEGIHFEQGDVLKWQPQNKYDVVICTGSIHHIPYEQQGDALRNISTMVKDEGFIVITDCYVDDYSDERNRKQSAAKLGYEYIRETIDNGGSDKVVEWTVDILWNDVLMHEFKPSYEKRLPLLRKYFAKVETMKSWPNSTPPGYGDYIHICKIK